MSLKREKRRAGRLKSSFYECLFSAPRERPGQVKFLSGLKMSLQIIIKINKVNKIRLFPKEPWENLNLFLWGE